MNKSVSDCCDAPVRFHEVSWLYSCTKCHHYCRAVDGDPEDARRRDKFKRMRIIAKQLNRRNKKNR